MSALSNWIVTIYTNEDDALIAGLFTIQHRTEQQASKEAMHEVEQNWNGLSWTMAEDDTGAINNVN